jgi:hypothetical protein
MSKMLERCGPTVGRRRAMAMWARYARRAVFGMIVASTVALGGLAAVSSAVAAAPGGVFSVFADCPLGAFKKLGVKPTFCGFRQVTGGELTIGSMDVPISQTITLQGGFITTENPANEREFFAYPAEGGESVSKTELEVSGGLSALIDCRAIEGRGSEERLERDACRTFSFYGRASNETATIESVASPVDPSIFDERAAGSGDGAALTFPIRVHLKNQFLGSSCYIGSETSPLQLRLTTGATSPPEGIEPLHGAVGKAETVEEGELEMLRLSGDSLVDNTFTAPGAEGCGESASSIIDPLIDAKLGLPSQAGQNSIVLTGAVDAASGETVEASEKQQEEAAAKKKQEEAEAKKKQEEAELETHHRRKHPRHRRHWRS